MAKSKTAVSVEQIVEATGADPLFLSSSVVSVSMLPTLTCKQVDA